MRGHVKTGRGERPRRWLVPACALLVLLAAVGGARATHLTIDTEGHTTLEQILTCSNPTPQGSCDPDTGYKRLTVQTLGADDVRRSYLVRDGVREGSLAIPNAQGGRENRRESLNYVSQMTDFQLADEESPARVEFTDPQGPPVESAWRPQEALQGFEIDRSVRQLNYFVPHSPIPSAGGGPGRPMDFALMTGDQADNMQKNETIWVRKLLEGGTPMNLNSGLSNAADYANPAALGASCAAFVTQVGGPQNAAQEGARYTGVQDYDDYDEGASPYFYDPDQPSAYWQQQGFPTYTGLMDRAQQLTFSPEGLDVPFYVTNGNHDVLVQGNENAERSFEDIATGCSKPLSSTANPSGNVTDGPDPNVLLSPGTQSMLVPPDPERQFTNHPQIKYLYGVNHQDNEHGFGFVDPQENLASNGAASYYAFDPPQSPGFRYINIDTNAEGGVAGITDRGNIDDPQFQWLKRELDAATAQNKLIVLFGHHPIRSMSADLADEVAGECTGTNDDALHPGNEPGYPGHDIEPGCDLDPRNSEPIHLGADPAPGDPRESLVELLDNYPNVIAYINGHTHVNLVERHPRTDPSNGVWWEVGTSAIADWPTQSRLIEFFDNHDGTLSIFGTVLDFAASSGTPPSPGNAGGFGVNDLAAIGRTLAYNDPQKGPPSGEGAPKDQNVELLVKDPRPTADLSVTKSDSPDPVLAGQQLTYTLNVHNGGPGASGETIVTDQLPAGVTLNSVTPSKGTCTQGTATVSCDLNTLASAESATVTIKVTPQQAGQITNQASVRGNVSDTNSANDSDDETTTVQPAADLSINKSDSPDPVKIGRVLTYTLQVQNHGPSTATGVKVTDQLPANVQFSSASGASCSVSGATVTCNLGNLTSGQTTITIKVKVGGSPRTIQNTASVAATSPQDPQPSNNADTEPTVVRAR